MPHSTLSPKLPGNPAAACWSSAARPEPASRPSSKTLVASSPDMRVLRAAGIQGEAELAFAGLHQLVWPLRSLIGQLGDAQAAVLQGVLGAAQDRPPGRFLVGAATLELLAAAAEERPLLAVVDDAHWLDGPSAEAITFAARRLHADPIALVLAIRDEPQTVFDARASRSCSCTAWTAGQPVPCSTAASRWSPACGPRYCASRKATRWRCWSCRVPWLASTPASPGRAGSAHSGAGGRVPRPRPRPARTQPAAAAARRRGQHG